jgi:IPT/TIG domain-containing protein/pre-peptidase
MYQRIARAFSLSAFLGFVAFECPIAAADINEFEPNNNWTLATPLPLNCDAQGSIDSPTDEDYFSFTLPADGPVQIYTTLTGSGADSWIDLFRSDLSLIESDDDDGIGLASHLGEASLPAGTYYIHLRPYFGGLIFTYVLSLWAPTWPSEIEPNNGILQATGISCETTGLRGDIGQFGDVDYWTFEVGPPTTVTVFGLTAPNRHDLTLTLYDHAGSQIATATDGGYELGPLLVANVSTGRFNLKVSSQIAGTHYDATIDIAGRICSTLSGIVPSIGSTAGGDLVFVSGDSFGTAAEVSMRIGNQTAPIVSVTPTLITAHAPAGSLGVADVTVVNRSSTLSLPQAYTYVAPDVAARFGNVNSGRGDRESVLLVDGLAGDLLTRTVNLALHQAFSVIMSTPSSRPSARYVLYGWVGAPSPSTLAVLPRNLGGMVLPPPFVPASPHPVVIFNNIGARQTLGAPTLPSRPAPAIVLQRSHGVGVPATATLQGIIQDDASTIPEHWSVTNAVILNVR